MLTTSVGRVVATVWPPIGEAAVGADKPGAGGAIAAALCEIVNVVPATTSVAVRAAPALAATVKLIVPLPVPDAPAEMVTKAALIVAVHAQVVPAVIGTDPLPPAAPNVDAVIAPATTVQDGVVGVSSFEQPSAARNSRITAGNSRREVIMLGAYTESLRAEHSRIRAVSADRESDFATPDP